MTYIQNNKNKGLEQRNKKLLQHKEDLVEADTDRREYINKDN